MPYNKGDFTQQGVAGDVSALVRLNEKRVMKVVLSSDDESDNCDISGAVTDLLNNEVYPIGPAVSGNIEITENGENINVAPYATATVNVPQGGGGGLDLKGCEVTIVSSTPGRIEGSTIIHNSIIVPYLNVANGDKIKAYYTYDDGSEQTFAYIGPVGRDAVFTVSDYVNCTPEAEGAPYVYPIDPTQDSSFTLTVTEWDNPI